MLDYKRLSALGRGTDPHSAPLIVPAENNPHESLSTYVVGDYDTNIHPVCSIQ